MRSPASPMVRKVSATSRRICGAPRTWKARNAEGTRARWPTRKGHCRLTVHSQRRFAIGLSEARGGGEEKRTRFRTIMSDGISNALHEVLPTLPKSKIDLASALILHMLRAVKTVDHERPDVRDDILEEIKGLLRAYLASVAASTRSTDQHALGEAGDRGGLRNRSQGRADAIGALRLIGSKGLGPTHQRTPRRSP
jgi:hypothetical protein